MERQPGAAAAAARTLMVDAVRRHGRNMGGSAPFDCCLVDDRAHHNPGKAAGANDKGSCDPTAPRRRSCGRSSSAPWPVAARPPWPGTLAADGYRRRPSIAPRAGDLDDPGQHRYIGYEFWRPYSARRHPGLPPHLDNVLVQSDHPAHPALVTVQDFLAVARIRAQPTGAPPEPHQSLPPDTG